MPTTYRGGKKKTAAKKQTGKKGSKSGSKKGGSSGGGGGDALAAQDPIIITGGGSVNVKIKLGQFRSNGGDNWKNAAANLASITVDGVTTALSRTSTITITFA